MTGPPGAGKSTVARHLATGSSRSALVRGDDFFTFVSDGWVEPWLPEASEQNHVVLEAAALTAGRFCAGGYTTVYDGVVGPWHLPAFAAATGLQELSYAVLLPSQATCLARVAGRTGHGFTDADAARRMHRQFVEAEVAARHLLTDDEATPAALAAAVRERWERGTLRHLAGAG